MAQYFSGQHGQIWIRPEGGTTPEGSNIASLQNVGHLRDWQLTSQMSVLDTTTMERTDRTLLHGVRSYNGTASMLYYREDGTTTSNVKRMIQNTFVTSERTDPNDASFGMNDQPELAYLTLRLWTGESSTVYDINCACFITSFSIQNAVGEVVSASIGFEGSGAPLSLDMVK